MLKVRDARPEDGPFLVEMLAIAADWRPEATVRSADEILRTTGFAHYVANWPRPGDCGVLALVDQPVGAAWFRFLKSSDPGYGYVSDDIPEVTVGVRADHRGQGFGEAMLRRLVERARAADIGSLSLSVEDDNPAMRLYERVGFSAVGHAEDATTMVLALDVEVPIQHGGVSRR